MREFTKDRCCECCQRFNFGVLYEDDMSDLIRRRMEERRRNLQIRNEIMEQQRIQQQQMREMEEKEEYQGMGDEEERKREKRKRKKRKKKRKEQQMGQGHGTIHEEVLGQNVVNRGAIQSVVSSQEIAMASTHSTGQMLYLDREKDVIEVDE